MKANLNTAREPWGPRSATDGSGSAAAAEGNAPPALRARASSRAARVLLRIDLHPNRPFCFYTPCPSLRTRAASHAMCVYLLWQQPTGWNSAVLQV